MIKVFFSYSRPINSQQNNIIKYIRYELQHESLFPVEIKNENYNMSPVFVINEAMKECDFFLCIAYEKEKILKADGTASYYTSPWLDIEIALAISYQLPFFIMKEEKLVDTVLLNSINPVPYYSLPNTTNNLIDIKYLKEQIMPELIAYINTLNQ